MNRTAVDKLASHWHHRRCREWLAHPLDMPEQRCDLYMAIYEAVVAAIEMAAGVADIIEDDVRASIIARRIRSLTTESTE